MNILVINGHPDKESYCQAIFQTIVENIDSKRHELEMINLNEEEFDPVLRYGYRQRMEDNPFILRSQSLIQWADHLIFVYPIWWSSMPSLLKGWIDRVFTPGIAYSANNRGSFILNYLRGKQFKKLLKGKTASIYATSMAPTWWYKVFSGPINIPDSYGISVLKNAVLNHCGIKTKRVSILGELGREVNTSSTRQKFLQKVAKEVRMLD